MVGSDGIWWDLVEWDLAGSGGIWWDLVESGGIWCGLVGFGRIWWDPVGSGTILGNGEGYCFRRSPFSETVKVITLDAHRSRKR